MVQRATIYPDECLFRLFLLFFLIKGQHPSKFLGLVSMLFCFSPVPEISTELANNKAWQVSIVNGCMYVHARDYLKCLTT